MKRRVTSSNTRLLVGAAAATCMANATWWMQPLIVNDVMQHLHASESRAGFVVTAETAAMVVIALALARTARGASYLYLCLAGAVLVIGGSVATLYTHTYGALNLARMVTGIGEGAFLLVSTASVSHLSNPDRAYGELNIVNIVFGAAMSFGLPLLVMRLHADVITFRFLCVVMIVLVLVSLATPPEKRYSPPAVGQLTRSRRRRVVALGLAVFSVSIGCCATWSFFVVLGLRTGLSEAAVDATVGYSILCALPSATLATLIGTRFGRFRPMAVTMILVVVAIFLLTHSSSPAIFRITACIVEASICFLIPYFFGVAAAEDASGAAATVAGGAFLSTGAVGPYLAGCLMQYLGVPSIAWFVLGANVVAAALFFWLENSALSNVSPKLAGKDGEQPGRAHGWSEVAPP